MFSGNLQLFLVISLMMYHQADPDGSRYSFLVDWFDSEASLVRHYYLFYFPVDNTVELFDIKNQRTFLKRTRVDGLHLHDLHEGANINVFGRLMTVAGFSDDYTRCKLSILKQKTFAMVKPDAVCKIGEIIKTIYCHGFTITKLKMTGFSQQGAKEFYAEHEGKSFLPQLVDYVTSGPVVAMELVAENAVSRWRNLIGPTDSEKARKDSPDSLRAIYGKDVTFNAVHGSDSPESAARELAVFFPKVALGLHHGPAATVNFCNSTCCIVKPHIVKAGQLGDVLQAVEDGGFRITAAQMFYMEQANAEEFYEVYKGVVPEYGGMVNQLVSGPCVALEVTGNGPDTPTLFRKLVGPSDPELARQLRPDTIRARFGVDRVANAVHCTDLAEDAKLEVEYFFRLLQ